MAKAEAQGQAVADFLLHRALEYRLWQTPLEKEWLRQLARWINVRKSRVEALHVLTALVNLERDLRETPVEDASCT